MNESYDVKAGRLKAADYEKNFCDKTPPLNLTTATVESSRCYFCYDAPCITACPTGINIPSFIRKISTGNVKGAAVDILTENIMGGTCARVCPVETLCEQACVRNTAEEKPVTIGQLQRYATDYLFDKKIQPFARAPRTGKTVAVIGAGPAGLSCAHRLAVLGHDVEVFEALEKPGGLNEYGLAAYKVVDEWAQNEVQFLMAIGGIKINYGQALGKDLSLVRLKKEYDSVFIGVGLSGVNSLGVDGEELPEVRDAVDYIADLRQTQDLSGLAVGRRVVVIGGGNTAIDIAVQVKLLGADEVTIAYRRGAEHMSATWKEQEFAQKTGVLIKYWSRPLKVNGDKNGVTSIDFEKTKLDGSGKLTGTGEMFSLTVDQAFKAIGQILIPDDLGDLPQVLEISRGKIVVDQSRRTTVAGIYAGGDCINGGKLTVESVQDGKIAAHTIHKDLTGQDAPDIRKFAGGKKSWRI